MYEQFVSQTEGINFRHCSESIGLFRPFGLFKHLDLFVLLDLWGGKEVMATVGNEMIQVNLHEATRLIDRNKMIRRIK